MLLIRDYVVVSEYSGKKSSIMDCSFASDSFGRVVGTDGIFTVKATGNNTNWT